jgi:hypothetical protein
MGDLRSVDSAVESVESEEWRVSSDSGRRRGRIARPKIRRAPLPRFACDVCGQTFCENKERKDHVVVKHDGKVFPCGLCAVTFTTRRNRARHWQRAHDKKTADVVAWAGEHGLSLDPCGTNASFGDESVSN